jgi:biopolymer transport protein ExbD
MAMSVGRKDGPVADMNVTPMADVIIVLLIIFMVAVPMLADDRTVALPRAVNSAEREEKQMVVVLRADGSLNVGKSVLSEPELAARLQAGLRDLSELQRVVYIRADEGLLYERVARVLELCRQSGAESVELMTAPRRR